MANKPTLSKDQLEFAEQEGRRLGFLIAGLDITQETRDALLEVLPFMTPEQLVEFGALLEANFLNEATNKANRDFAVELQKIDEEYHEKVDTAVAEAAGSLQALDQMLNSKNS